MTKLLTVLAIAILSVSPAYAVFFDDFDSLGGGALNGHIANTGQTWGGAAFGGGELVISTAYGQVGTNGVGRDSAGFADNQVPLGQTISSGQHFLAADLKVNTTGDQHQVFLLNSALNENVSFKVVSGEIVFEGVYTGHANVPIGGGFTTGNLRVRMDFDLGAQTGAVSWSGISNPAISGNVNLGAFTNPPADATYDFSKILLFATAANVIGFDNVGVDVSAPNPIPSATIFADDFNASTAGALTGQAAQTGQVYGAFSFFDSGSGPYPSLDVSTSFGHGGTQGAGNTVSAGNSVGLGATLSTGIYRLSTDLVVDNSGSSPQFWLTDSANNVQVSLLIINDRVGFEASPAFGLTQYNLSDAFTLPTTVHLDLDIDLDAKSIALSWQDLNNLANNGTVNIGSYSNAYAPDLLHLWLNGGGGARGYNSISLTAVPEPSGFALFTLGAIGVAVLKRKRSL